MIPHIGKGALDIDDGRATDADGGIAIGQARLRLACQPCVGDAHAAGGGVGAIHRQRLAVVARRHAQRVAQVRRVDEAHIDPRAPHPAPERGGHVQGAIPIDQDPHGHAGGRAFGEGVGEARADDVVAKDVVLDMNPVLCLRDCREPVSIGRGAILEQLQLVAQAQGCARHPAQAPVGLGPPAGPAQRLGWSIRFSHASAFSLVSTTGRVRTAPMPRERAPLPGAPRVERAWHPRATGIMDARHADTDALAGLAHDRPSGPAHRGCKGHVGNASTNDQHVRS